MSISKKTKTDFITASIKKYLTGRNIDQHQPKLQISVEEHALKCVIDRECSLRNAISYSPSETLDQQSAESQYMNFKSWISGSADHFIPELAQLLYPLFSHIYIRLLGIPGAPAAAHRFHKRHLSTFMGNPEFKQFIQQLGEISSFEEIEHCPAVASFVSARYCVTLTKQTYNHLHRYLETSECSLILSILNQEVDVMVGDWLGAGSRHDYRSGLLTPPLSDHSMDVEDAEKEELDRFEDLRKIIRDGSPAAPSVSLYRLQNAEEVCLSGEVDQQGIHLVSGGEDGQVRLWRLQPSEESVHLDYASSIVRLGCDSETFTSDTNAAAYQQLRTSATVKDVGNGVARYLRGHAGSVYDAIFLPDDKLIVSVSEDSTVRLWDKSNGAGLAAYHGHLYPIWCVASDTVGITFATGSMDRTARLWQPDIPHPLRVFVGHEGDVDCINFHPNGAYVLTGSCDRTVRMWTSSDQKCVRTFTGHKGVVSEVKVSPCGSIVATAGEDKKIRIWDLAQCKIIKELKGHTDRVTNLVWGDSRLLCSAGLDNTIRIWDVKLGDSELRETYTFPGTILGLNMTSMNTLIGITRTTSAQQMMMNSMESVMTPVTNITNIKIQQQS